MRILLADDRATVRSAMRLALEHEPGLTVDTEAASAPELLAKLDKARPDLVILDWELPGVRTVHLVPVLRLLVPGLRIIAVSSRDEVRSAALAAGVDAFASKGEGSERLLEAVRAMRRPHAVPLPRRQ